MQHLKTLLVLALFCGIAPVALAQEAGTQQPAKLERPVTVRLNYLLSLPKDYDKQEKWPLMLFLHGAGERGHNLDLVKVHGPPKLIAQGKDLPFIVVSPQCPADMWWESLELITLLDEIQSKYKVDPDRVVVTGLSMGGFGTWRLANYAPDRFAAIAPICGGAETFWAKRIAPIPTWVFHGTKDGAVPFERSQTMVDALKREKAEPRFTIYKDVGHDSWTETYNNPELYEWLLQQKRKPKQ